jgi:hypothetical protein
MQSKGTGAEARKRCEHTIRLNPDAAVASNHLAYMYAEGGRNRDLACRWRTARRSPIPRTWLTRWVGCTTEKECRLFCSANVPTGRCEGTEERTERYHLGLAYRKVEDVLKSTRVVHGDGRAQP